MTEPGSHISYSAQDIERYLNGGMSAKEMHDMEKAALQDPFLADAIEGYGDVAMPTAHKHLNEITALIQAPKEAATVITMPSKSFGWWRIAAMIVVVAGVGIFSWYIIGLNNNTTDKQQVAAVPTKDTTTTQQEQALTAKADTQGNVANADETTTGLLAYNYDTDKKSKRLNKPAPLARNEAMETTIEAADDHSTAASAPETDSVLFRGIAPGVEIAKNDTKSVKTIAPLQGRGAGLMNNLALNNFSGYVFDKAKKPVAGAVIDTNNKPVAFTDATGYFKIVSPDSVLNVSVSSVGYEQTNTDLFAKRNNNISIEPSSMSLSEVVVTGYGAKREKKAYVKPVSDSAYPTGGWQSFQEYVYKRMNKTFDSTNGSFADMHGMIEIEFSIDEKGELYNLAVTKSLNKEADEKALQALKEGPRWISSKKNKQKKNKVVINF